MELWIPITIAAAFFQNLRSALQKHLKSATLSTTGATYVRFCYAVPFAAIYLAIVCHVTGESLPVFPKVFVGYVLSIAISQIVATALLVHLFSLRNFAVGTTYSKTEAMQTALFGVVILGESVGYLAGIAIAVSVLGVMLISLSQSGLGLQAFLGSLTRREALIGLASGAAFGIAAVSVRAASLSLPSGEFVIRAAYTLLWVTVVQTLVMTIYLYWREPGELTRVVKAWRIAGLVGLFGMLASVCWFTAMTLQNAAFVRALGQIELLFTFIVSYVVFKERSNRLEVIGIVLVVAGILVLVLRY